MFIAARSDFSGGKVCMMNKQERKNTNRHIEGTSHGIGAKAIHQELQPLCILSLSIMNTTTIQKGDKK
jgi:hypothetical protein